MRTSCLILVCLILTIPYVIEAEVTPQEVKETEQLIPIEDEIIQFRNSAELGDANAMFKLGEIYSYGEGVTEDANIAVEWYLKAAQVGNAEAMYKLGDMYYFGEGVNEDTNEAIIWYTKAANAGHSKAMYELGDTYYYGWGVQEDSNKADEWYSKAFRTYCKDAETGDSYAMQQVAKMYENGEGVTKDYTQALQWYSKAAEAGNIDAMYRIGLMYENGKGVSKDYEQAKNWYRKAIESGDNEANLRLVVIYMKEYYKVVLWGFLAVFIVGGFIYAIERKQTDEDVKLLDIDKRPRKWGFWITIRRYVGGFFIYLLYWLTLWGAFTRVVGATLSGHHASELVEEGAIESIWDYGWGNHYIWFLFIFCFVTYCSAVLAGATAKKKGVVVAVIANLPVVVFSSLACILLYVSQIKVESSIAWKVVLPVSILGSIFFSVVGGSAGERWQNNTFSSKTIFGIRPLHWWWLIFPLNLVIQTLIPKIMTALAFLVGSTLMDIKNSVFLFLMFVVITTFIYFVIWGWYKSFCLLSIEYKGKVSKCGIVLRVLFYLFGIPLLFETFYILCYILFR